jgi:polysulfide reductase chain C
MTMTKALESQVQTEWKWPVAADLFLAGTGAGSYAAGIAASYGGPAWETVARTGIALAFPLLVIATFFLMADLGVKRRVLRVFLNPGTSWITRGSFIVTVFTTLSLAHILLVLWPGSRALDDSLVRTIGGVNVVFAIGVMIYTGALLSASRPIAFWNTAMLPVLFLVSAATMGTMAVSLATPVTTAVLGLLAKVLLVLLILKILVVAFYVQASHRTGESRASARLLLKGRLAGMFWFGLVAIGLLLPLALLLLYVTGSAEADPLLVRVASVLGLVGGLLTRRLILAAGIRNPLRAAGLEFTFPSSIPN